LRASASAYLNRTFGTPTNGKIWTFSTWFKLGNGQFGPGGNLLGTTDNGGASGNYVQLGIDYTNGMMYINDYSSGTAIYVTSSNLLRDSSAWYHLMYVYDSTQTTAANRIIYYINGVQVTSYSNTTYPSQNYNTYINNSGQVTYFGANQGSVVRNFVGSYFADSYFVDGQALTPTSFGAFDTVTGVWNPKKYTGTYGTNGFYLNFSDNSGATATTIGKDSSGNGNNWTPNNISVTNVAAPNTNDSMVDSPTNYGTDTGAGGEVRGNYAVVSPVTGYAYTSSNGNLTTYGGNTNCYFSMPVIGKMYFEAYCTSLAGGGQMGFVKNASIATNTVGYNQSGYYGVNYASANTYWVNGTNDGITHGTITNQTMKFAVDGATGKVWIGSGSTWFNSGDPANGTNPAFTLSLSSGDLIYPMITSQSSTYTFTINTGQHAFGNAAPSGFKAMCTQNMNTPTISNGANYMAASTYTGTGASLTVSNAVNSISFQPDMVWIKSRSAATSHKWTDSVRGVTKGLVSNTTAAETTDTNGLTAFGASGFTVGTDTVYNNSGATYVGWQWKGGGTAVSNTAGSITSSVSASTTAGFSVVTYTGTGATGTIGHGLGVAPSVMIMKKRSAVGSWKMYHASLGNTQIVEVNDTGAAQTSSTYWNNTSPTSTLITVGSNGDINASSETYVAYCFAAISGYSAFGSYTGNGSTDGPFVYCGFRPKFVLMKIYTSATHWVIIDSSRDPYNVASLRLCPNLALDEATLTDPTCDLVSNGFKIRTTTATSNTSGQSYIYAAFAENPFTISRAR
jgi:hypothetical protein